MGRHGNIQLEFFFRILPHERFELWLAYKVKQNSTSAKFGRNPQLFTLCKLSANLAHVNIHSVRLFPSPKNRIMRGLGVCLLLRIWLQLAYLVDQVTMQ